MQLSNYVIEELKIDDVVWFVEQACTSMMVEELKKPELVNHSQFYALSSVAMEQGTAFIVKKDGVPVGAIGGIVSPNIYNPDISNLVEMFWYVFPEYRNTRASLLLLNAFIKKGEEVADITTFSLLKESPVNMKTLERKGFVISEFGFVKENK